MCIKQYNLSIMSFKNIVSYTIYLHYSPVSDMLGMAWYLIKFYHCSSSCIIYMTCLNFISELPCSIFFIFDNMFIIDYLKLIIFNDWSKTPTNLDDSCCCIFIKIILDF